MPRIELAYPIDYPPARGHFRGNPVIPGAALLSDTIDSIAAALGADSAQCQIGAAKFPAFARPGDRVVIDFSGDAAQGARFQCLVEDRVVLSGNVTWHPGRAA